MSIDSRQDTQHVSTFDRPGQCWMGANGDGDDRRFRRGSPPRDCPPQVPSGTCSLASGKAKSRGLGFQAFGGRGRRSLCMTMLRPSRLKVPSRYLSQTSIDTANVSTARRGTYISCSSSYYNQLASQIHVANVSCLTPGSSSLPRVARAPSCKHVSPSTGYSIKLSTTAAKQLSSTRLDSIRSRRSTLQKNGDQRAQELSVHQELCCYEQRNAVFRIQ